MNKLMAMLFLFGAIAGFGLSVRTASYQVQDQTPHGSPVGEPRTAYVTKNDRAFYVAFGAANMAASLYFVARIRREES